MYFSLMLIFSSWTMHTSLLGYLGCGIWRKWGVLGDFGVLVGKGLTKMASGRLEVCLSLADKRAPKSPLGIVLSLACSGIWRFCWAKRLVLPASKWTKQPAREPLLMAFMMRLQATLWRSVIMPKVIVCWYPERIWRALSACLQSAHWRLVDI